MQLVKNDLDSLEAVFESAVFLSDFLARYSRIDRNIRDRVVKDAQNFEDLYHQRLPSYSSLLS